MKNNEDYLRGRRMTEAESIAMMFPDSLMMTDSEINDVLDKFNAVPFINPISISDVKKMIKITK